MVEKFLSTNIQQRNYQVKPQSRRLCLMKNKKVLLQQTIKRARLKLALRTSWKTPLPPSIAVDQDANLCLLDVHVPMIQ
jgi:hypothetical protein